jgi:superfamily II DNA or RNA helicase
MSYFLNNYVKFSYPEATDQNLGLRNPQIGAIHAIASHFTIRNEACIITLPTGCGKTAVLVIAAYILKAKRVLVLAPSRILRAQLAECFQELEILKRIGVLPEDIPKPTVKVFTTKLKSADEWEGFRSADVVIALPTGISPGNDATLLPPPDLFDVVLVDEAHHSAANTWDTLLSGFPNAKKVLFTATPFRRDRKEIRGRMAYTYPLKRAYEEGLYGKIDFVSAKSEAGGPDVAVAKKAAQIYTADRSAGFDHRLMVRTDKIERVEEIAIAYKDYTDLRLESIDSKTSWNSVKLTLERLRADELDGVICVNMLGEGFDYPNFKIAAIHSPHKSLEVTLQFIGRFVRTAGPTIGDAKFIAIPTDIELQTTKLYEESAIWSEIIPNLLESRLATEESTRESIDSFQTISASESFDTELSLYSFRPYLHAKIYEAHSVINLKDFALPSSYEELYRWHSSDEDTLIVVARQRFPVRWMPTSPLSEMGVDLFIIFHDKKNGLIFLNSSRRTEKFYSLADASILGQNPQPVPSWQIEKVLNELRDLTCFNVGLRNRLGVDRSESYRTSSGREAQLGIDKVDGLRYSKGHIMARGTTERGLEIIGISGASSKVWSHRNEQIPILIQWCRMVGDHIRSNTSVKTNTNLDFISSSQPIVGLPDGALFAEWEESVFDGPVDIRVSLPDGSIEQRSLLDFEFEIDRGNSTVDSLAFNFVSSGVTIQCRYTPLAADAYTFFESDPPQLEFVEHSEPYTFLEFARRAPISFYFADGSKCVNKEIVTSGTFSPFDLDRIQTVDWNAAGIDITVEYVTHQKQAPGVHEYLKRILADGNGLLIYDHGSGEMADFVKVTHSVDIFTVTLFHCKASSSLTPGHRVGDLYEVCGQASKCLVRLFHSREFSDHLIHRCDGSNRILEGQNLFDQWMKIIPNSNVEYKVVVVQPGVAKAGIPPKLLTILAAPSLFLQRGRMVTFEVLCSA